MKTLVILACLLLVSVYAHGSGKHHGSSKHSNDTCKYRTTTGVLYDFRLLDAYAVSDLTYYDPATQNTFYFSPCGAVSSYHQHGESCPEGSSVCLVTKNGQTTNFGSNKFIQYADAVEDNANVEATYGNGEICNSGAHRRTFVEYVCSPFSVEPVNSIVNVTMINDCTLKFVVRSAYVCSVEKYCTSNMDKESCDVTRLNLCTWSNGKCIAGCSYWTSMHASGLFAIILISSAGILLACSLGLCLCVCRRRRCKRACASKKLVTRKARCSRRSAPKKVVKKEDSADYAPFQMPFQLIPGGVDPINPYSNIQGYPMVNLSAATEEQV